MITVHHLNFSRSNREIWLLEELGLPYELVKYERDTHFRAPTSLQKIHPLGKAPVIVDDGLVLAESAIILTYINDRHGEGRFAPKPGTPKRVLHDEWLQYVESSAAFPIMMTLIGKMMDGLTAFVASSCNAIASVCTMDERSRTPLGPASVTWSALPSRAAISLAITSSKVTRS